MSTVVCISIAILAGMVPATEHTFICETSHWSPATGTRARSPTSACEMVYGVAGKVPATELVLREQH